jgi:hypothetical protein
LTQRWFGILAMIVLMAAPGLAYAQNPVRPDSAAADTVPADTLRRGPSPRGALFRSLIFPAWGQAANGSYLRGGVAFAIETTSWYMLLKTMAKLSESRGVERRVVDIVSDSLRLEMAEDTALARQLSDPFAFDDAVGNDPRAARIRGLIEARKSQRQDWITYTLFFTMMSGIDAYVSTQLQDFPVGISGEARRDGSVGVRFTVPVGTRHR